MEFKDYYRTLGVDTDADAKTIKSAYRRLARQYHPDVSTEHQAEERFKEVTEAYEVLGDADKRAEYDELRRYGQGGKAFEPPPGWQPQDGFAGNTVYEGDFSEFFRNIFGGGGAGPRAQAYSQRGEDIETDLAVFLEETLSEQQKALNYRLPKINAQGQREVVSKTLKVKIPAGVRDGERIRLKGQGDPGVGSGPAGDLYLRIRLVPHPLFDVEGHNLVLTVPIAPWEAALGAKIEIPTLEGDIRLSIPENSQPGKRIRVKQRGLPSREGRGDLFVVLRVILPEQCDSESVELWRQLAERCKFDPRASWRV